ncbi:hypothetical protein [Micromonospora sp. HM5-17]|uniref:hypothetical protein n=1 Tax=Micromonospora sp. HM5-17 TaxID=2487710 RepID=UPI000F4A6073|nr:hypothetical protein [Micromonospora sp. HM5-17]ROT31608.1 hypothetical protein EF879_14410 [Micromonospora sp. HM5-17]
MGAPATEDVRQGPDEPDRRTAAPTPTGRTGGRVAALVESTLIGIGLALLAVTPRPAMMGDGLARYQALLQLLDQRQWSQVPYSLIGPLFAAPLEWLGRWLGDPRHVVAQYNLVLFVLGLAALHGLLRDRMDAALLRRFLLFLVAGSMIAAHVQDFYGEVFTMVTVGVGLLAATLPGTGRWTRSAGWVAVVLGVANTPATLAGLGLVAGLLCLRTRRLRYLLVPLAALALVMGEAWLRFDDPLHSSYAGSSGGRTVMPYSGEPGFSYPFPLGVVAILFSFGKGLLWFTPGLFLPLRRRVREAEGTPDRARPVASGPGGCAEPVDVWSIWLLWTVFVAGLVLVYAPWWSWYGGLYWGPRFFLLAILPASLALAVCVRAERAGPWANLGTLAAVLLSVWGAANSLVYGQVRPRICYDNNWYLEALCHFTPEYSPLWAPLVETPTLTGLQRVTLACYALVLLWFAVPLLGRIARQAGAAVRDRHPDLLVWRAWRW